MRETRESWSHNQENECVLTELTCIRGSAILDYSTCTQYVCVRARLYTDEAFVDKSVPLAALTFRIAPREENSRTGGTYETGIRDAPYHLVIRRGCNFDVIPPSRRQVPVFRCRFINLTLCNIMSDRRGGKKEKKNGSSPLIALRDLDLRSAGRKININTEHLVIRERAELWYC